MPRVRNSTLPAVRISRAPYPASERSSPSIKGTSDESNESVDYVTSSARRRRTRAQTSSGSRTNKDVQGDRLAVTPTPSLSSTGYPLETDFHRARDLFSFSSSSQKAFSHIRSLMDQQDYDAAAAILLAATGRKDAIEATRKLQLPSKFTSGVQEHFALEKHGLIKNREHIEKMAGLVDGGYVLCSVADGKPFVSPTNLFDAFMFCHHHTGHGGRDKTFTFFRKHFANIPKLLLQAFVQLCPTCANKHGKSEDDDAAGLWLNAGRTTAAASYMSSPLSSSTNANQVKSDDAFVAHGCSSPSVLQSQSSLQLHLDQTTTYDTTASMARRRSEPRAAMMHGGMPLLDRMRPPITALSTASSSGISSSSEEAPALTPEDEIDARWVPDTGYRTRVLAVPNADALNDKSANTMHDLHIGSMRDRVPPYGRLPSHSFSGTNTAAQSGIQAAHGPDARLLRHARTYDMLPSSAPPTSTSFAPEMMNDAFRQAAAERQREQAALDMVHKRDSSYFQNEGIDPLSTQSVPLPSAITSFGPTYGVVFGNVVGGSGNLFKNGDDSAEAIMPRSLYGAPDLGVYLGQGYGIPGLSGAAEQSAHIGVLARPALDALRRHSTIAAAGEITFNGTVSRDERKKAIGAVPLASSKSSSYLSVDVGERLSQAQEEIKRSMLAAELSLPLFGGNKSWAVGADTASRRESALSSDSNGSAHFRERARHEWDESMSTLPSAAAMGSVRTEEGASGTTDQDGQAPVTLANSAHSALYVRRHARNGSAASITAKAIERLSLAQSIDVPLTSVVVHCDVPSVMRGSRDPLRVPISSSNATGFSNSAHAQQHAASAGDTYASLAGPSSGFGPSPAFAQECEAAAANANPAFQLSDPSTFTMLRRPS